MTPIRENSATAVPVAPFRERFLELEARGEITPAQLAKHLGWTHHKWSGNWGDTSRVKRTLGLKPHASGRPSQRNYYRTMVRVETAAKLCDALGLDPWEVGL